VASRELVQTEETTASINVDYRCLRISSKDVNCPEGKELVVKHTCDLEFFLTFKVL